jgi:hypothetical protein
VFCGFVELLGRKDAIIAVVAHNCSPLKVFLAKGSKGNIRSRCQSMVSFPLLVEIEVNMFITTHFFFGLTLTP